MEQYVVGVQAPNREALLESVDGFLAHFERDRVPGAPYLTVRMDGLCSEVREYPTRGDVPAETVQCNCGAEPQHYFILYKEIADADQSQFL